MKNTQHSNNLWKLSVPACVPACSTPWMQPLTIYIYIYITRYWFLTYIFLIDENKSHVYTGTLVDLYITPITTVLFLLHTAVKQIINKKTKIKSAKNISTNDSSCNANIYIYIFALQLQLLSFVYIYIYIYIKTMIVLYFTMFCSIRTSTL